MKGKLIKSIGSVLLLLAIMTGVVYAFSLGSTDGTWGQIDYLVESPCTTATDLFFSEYVYNERRQDNIDQVAIEIYNGTGLPVDLTGYSVSLYRTSGTPNPVPVPLTAGFLNDQDVWVLVSNNAMEETDDDDQDFPDNENYTTIVLLKGTDVIDVIGSLSNPTTTNPSGKNDRTFRRNVGVCAGDTDGDTTYAEWTINNNDTFSDLGFYTGNDQLPGANGAECDAYGRATNSAYNIHDVVGVIYNRNVGPGGENERWARNSSVCAGDVDGDILFYNNASFGSWTYTSGTPSYDDFGTYTNTCGSTLPGLIISEYAYQVIGGNNNDRIAIEIYNGTGATVNLSTFKLLLFTNDRDFTEVQLNSVDLANGGRYVVANTAGASVVTEQQIFTETTDNHRTVVLIENYTQQVIDAMNADAAEYLAIQGVSLTDENQVRYGQVSWGCPSTVAGFANQSGFGFEGIEVNQSGLAEGEPFPVGRFCHYNSPINAGNNAMEQVPFTLTINDIACDAGWHIDDGVDDLSFTYITNLDETSNGSQPCEYGPGDPGWPTGMAAGSAYPNIAGDIGPNRNGCADMVNFTAAASTQEFTCVNTANPTHTVDYTVSILGFTPTQAGGVCPSEPVGEVSFNRIYTAETAKNCFCVYAAYTRGQITPVTLYNFSAENAEDGILVSWETMTETNNLGFNIMRAESVDGAQTQVNPELIMSEIAPGDAFGAYYEFLDETVETGKTYYYWLIDVPLNSIDLPGVYGPVMVERQ
jgi:hypothetical protein